MLPPDTSSNLLPWRVMVLLMQVCGGFPYRMTTTNGRPVFSLQLCLWSVFVQLMMVFVNGASFKEIFMVHVTSDFGTAVYIYTVLATVIAMCLVPMLLAVKSDVLAALLHDMSEIKDVSLPPTYRWYCKIKTQVMLLSLIMFTIVSWKCGERTGYSEITIAVVIIPVSSLCAVNFSLPQELPFMVFGFLARRLFNATETKVATVSILLGPDGSFKCESDVEAAMVAMDDLEAVIREVEVQREKGTRCFFPAITIFLLVALLLTITSPYAIKQDMLMEGTTISALLFGYYIMGRLCHLGQAFVSQVSAAEELLKDLKVKSRRRCLKKKVSQVMGSLSPLLTFDMCGWYTLSYSSFLGLMNTALTYVVIILQVGGQAVETAANADKTSG